MPIIRLGKGLVGVPSLKPLCPLPPSPWIAVGEVAPGTSKQQQMEMAATAEAAAAAATGQQQGWRHGRRQQQQQGQRLGTTAATTAAAKPSSPRPRWAHAVPKRSQRETQAAAAAIGT